MSEPIVRRAARRIYEERQYLNDERSAEDFDAYDRNPKSLEPEFRSEVKDAYRDAQIAVSLCVRAAESAAAREEADFGDAATGVIGGFISLLKSGLKEE